MFHALKVGHVYKIIKDANPNTDVNAIIKFQDGPIKEVGINGIQNEDLLEVLIDRLEYLQEKDGGKYACEENDTALHCVKAARKALVIRTRNRVNRGVEGTSRT